MKSDKKTITCVQCGAQVIRTGTNQKFCIECAQLNIKIKAKKYRQSDKYKKMRELYLKTHNQKEYQKKYRESYNLTDKYKQYRQSVEYKELQKEYNKKYRESYKLTDKYKQYRQSVEYKELQKRYHKLHKHKYKDRYKENEKMYRNSDKGTLVWLKRRYAPELVELKLLQLKILRYCKNE